MARTETMGERINVLFQRRNWLLITEREFHQILAQFQMGLSDFIIKRTFQFDTACLQKWALNQNMFDNLTRRNNWMEIPFAFDRKKIFCVFTSDDHGLFAHFGNFQKMFPLSSRQPSRHSVVIDRHSNLLVW